MKKPQDPASASNEMAEKLRIWHQNFIDGGGAEPSFELVVDMLRLFEKKYKQALIENMEIAVDMLDVTVLAIEKLVESDCNLQKRYKDFAKLFVVFSYSFAGCKTEKVLERVLQNWNQFMKLTSSVPRNILFSKIAPQYKLLSCLIHKLKSCDTCHSQEMIMKIWMTYFKELSDNELNKKRYKFCDDEKVDSYFKNFVEKLTEDTFDKNIRHFLNRFNTFASKNCRIFSINAVLKEINELELDKSQNIWVDLTSSTLSISFKADFKDVIVEFFDGSKIYRVFIEEYEMVELEEKHDLLYEFTVYPKLYRVYDEQDQRVDDMKLQKLVFDVADKKAKMDALKEFVFPVFKNRTLIETKNDSFNDWGNQTIFTTCTPSVSLAPTSIKMKRREPVANESSISIQDRNDHIHEILKQKHNESDLKSEVEGSDVPETQFSNKVSGKYNKTVYQAKDDWKWKAKEKNDNVSVDTNALFNKQIAPSEFGANSEMVASRFDLDTSQEIIQNVIQKNDAKQNEADLIDDRSAMQSKIQKLEEEIKSLNEKYSQSTAKIEEKKVQGSDPDLFSEENIVNTPKSSIRNARADLLERQANSQTSKASKAVRPRKPKSPERRQSVEEIVIEKPPSLINSEDPALHANLPVDNSEDDVVAIEISDPEPVPESPKPRKRRQPKKPVQKNPPTNLKKDAYRFDEGDEKLKFVPYKSKKFFKSHQQSSEPEESEPEKLPARITRNARGKIGKKTDTTNSKKTVKKQTKQQQSKKKVVKKTSYTDLSSFESDQDVIQVGRVGQIMKNVRRTSRSVTKEVYTYEEYLTEVPVAHQPSNHKIEAAPKIKSPIANENQKVEEKSRKRSADGVVPTKSPKRVSKDNENSYDSIEFAQRTLEKEIFDVSLVEQCQAREEESRKNFNILQDVIGKEERQPEISRTYTVPRQQINRTSTPKTRNQKKAPKPEPAKAFDDLKDSVDTRKSLTRKTVINLNPNVKRPLTFGQLEPKNVDISKKPQNFTRIPAELIRNALKNPVVHKSPSANIKNSEKADDPRKTAKKQVAAETSIEKIVETPAKITKTVPEINKHVDSGNLKVLAKNVQENDLSADLTKDCALGFVMDYQSSSGASRILDENAAEVTPKKPEKANEYKNFSSNLRYNSTQQNPVAKQSLNMKMPIIQNYLDDCVNSGSPENSRPESTLAKKENRPEKRKGDSGENEAVKKMKVAENPLKQRSSKANKENDKKKANSNQITARRYSHLSVISTSDNRNEIRMASIEVQHPSRDYELEQLYDDIEDSALDLAMKSQSKNVSHDAEKEAAEENVPLNVMAVVHKSPSDYEDYDDEDDADSTDLQFALDLECQKIIKDAASKIGSFQLAKIDIKDLEKIIRQIIQLKAAVKKESEEFIELLKAVHLQRKRVFYYTKQMSKMMNGAYRISDEYYDIAQQNSADYAEHVDQTITASRDMIDEAESSIWKDYVQNVCAHMQQQIATLFNSFI